jgi:uncharacterized DUF497 family protein
MMHGHEEAEEVVRGRLKHREWSALGYDALARHIVEGLDQRGLLATPATRQAVEACKGYARYQDLEPHLAKRPLAFSEAEAVRDAGRALLAEEAERAPKPRWVVVGREIRRDGNAYGFCSFETEQQARAVSAALNGLGGTLGGTDA